MRPGHPLKHAVPFLSLILSAVLLSCGNNPGSRRTSRQVPPVPQTQGHAAGESASAPQQRAGNPEEILERRPNSEAAGNPGSDQTEALALENEELVRLQPGEEAEEDLNLPAEEPTLLEQLTEASLPEDFSLSESRKEILTATKSELPLVLKPEVVKIINYFSGKGLKTFQRTLARGEAYRPMIERILDDEGVPRELFHLAQAESGFRPKARSWARATGMWQFMSFRGRQYGLRQNRYVDERYDPEEATRASARHLKDLYLEFGDWYLAMAAYNGGPLRVKRGIEKTGGRDFWEMSRRRLLRRETRNYVPIILAMVYMGKNPELYLNEDFQPAAPIRYDTVATTSEIHLNLISDLTGASYQTLRELNPALKRSATPPDDYFLRLPPGAGEAFAVEIAKIPEDKRLAWRSHRMDEGETLAAVAKKYGVASEKIAALNELDGGQPAAGTRLTIPAPAAKVKYYYSYGSAGGLLESGTGRYRIARGDTLGGISRRFGVSIGQLKRWNGLSSSRIRAGRYLIVRPEGTDSKGTVTSGDGHKYVVRRGDNLGLIARRHRTTVGKLKAWNGLRSTRIYPGQSLVVGPKRAPTRAAESGRTASAKRTVIREPSADGNRYRIRRGDTLGAVSQRFGVSVAELKSWNKLRSSRIRAGNYLVVRPAGAGTSTAAATRQPAAVSAARPAGPASSGQKYVIRRGDNLQTIANRFGVTVADLKAWNGLRGTRIIAGDSLVVRPGSRNTETASASDAEPTQRQAATPIRYRIRPGDNLSTIASRHGVTVGQLRSWNSLRGNRIVAGEHLNIHGTAGEEASGPSSGMARTAAAPSGGDREAITYQIRRGDNLGAIASRHGVTVAQLQAWNGLHGTRITAGETLIVKNGGSAKGGVYEVRRGDTLGSIAQRFGVTVRQLKQWNGLRSAIIFPGTLLRVTPPDSQS